MLIIHPRLRDSFKYLVSRGICQDCKWNIPISEAYHIYESEKLCQTCKNDDYFNCHACESLYQMDEGYDYNDDRYCNNCFNDRYDYCHRCNYAYPQDEITYIERYDERYCESCIGHNFNQCEDCHEYLHMDDIQIVNGDYFCPDCVPEPDEEGEEEESETTQPPLTNN